jgi:hypothetical protein
MGRYSRCGEGASERLWTLDDVYCGRARLHRLPFLCYRVRLSYNYASFARKSVPRGIRSLLTDYVYRIKALLFTLLRTFEFELAIEPADIIRKTGIVGRPLIASNPSAGPQLPLLIRLAND